MSAKNPFAPEMLVEVAPPYTRKRIGERYIWSDELELAHGVAQAEGVKLLVSYHDYQVAKLVGEGVKLCIYPHKTSAGNHHLRVRDEGSKDKARAAAVARALDKSREFWCTFSSHNQVFR